MDITIIPISKAISKKTFDCGIPELNRYFNQFAFPNDKKNIGKTFAAISNSNKSQPLGYYTVSMAQITFSEMPEILKKGLPKYPIPFHSPAWPLQNHLSSSSFLINKYQAAACPGKSP